MPPPPFLLGIALIFWGVMTDRIWVGLGCALVVEAGRYSRVRWPFGEIAAVRAWRLSVLIMVITLALVLMQRADVRAMARVFSWLPVILLPLQFVQSYGTSPVIGLGTFSLMVRRRRQHAEKHGLPFHEAYFSFGRVYLMGILISSSLGSNSNNPVFFPVVLGIIAWTLLASPALSWQRLVVALLFSLLPAGGAAFMGGNSLMKLYSRLMNMSVGGGPNDRARGTAMGALGELKLSGDILWRLKPVQGVPPRLLRTSSYQTYMAGRWTNDILPPDVRRPELDFKQLPEIQNPDNPDDPEDKFVQCSAGGGDLSLVRSNLPRFHLRGGFPEKSLVPVPGGATAFHNINLYTDLDLNSMGAVRFDPVDPIFDSDILWNPDRFTERPPWQRSKPIKGVYTWPDLDIPRVEQEALASVVEELHLTEGTLTEKIERLHYYFADHFAYSLYNETPLYVAEDSTLLSTFLTKTRKGHCEFFATATCMVLRQAGVPTRYTSGFALAEYDQSAREYMIRGTHAHAWCRAWDDLNRRWIDVDLTPGNWIQLEPQHTKPFQAAFDWWKINQEAFLVWRSKPGRMTIITVALIAPVLIGLAIIGRILWRSRQQVARSRAAGRGATIFSTPLNALEKPARRVMGRRPEGQPLAAWLQTLASRLEQPELLNEALSLHQQARFDPAAQTALQSQLSTLALRLKPLIRKLPKKPA